ncbi:MAG: hopanoid biosynthesis-associated protein HpnK [Alphaproteobacteria bacterium]|nr:hopanoid biosynthesis-associated protein HpnK [Alphaproteobacteria bacterium]MDE2111547.1 hopanoid biosynthesis-associated protein HpnK [Alphaproteobacteria bacterium]MDE2494991.1 hopanoid biosynthesis-associated protein HpnK [Alphaproteobacteria bacterium]
MKQLIVTADDFGAAREVNDAVERAYEDGILTAASLMVAAPAAADAVTRAKALSLPVGLHLVLVEGRPVLPAAAIPDLVDADGFFRTDMVLAGAAMFFLPKMRRQLAAEIEAQFKAFAATGLPLDHVNAHKHFHLHPTIAALTLRIGRRFGLNAMRVPYEPAGMLRQIEPKTGRSIVVETWARRLRKRLAAAGVFSPDRVFGLAWSGAMTPARLQGLLRQLPDGVTEIYLHPATAAEFSLAAPGYQYKAELTALVSQEVIDIAKKNKIQRGAFRDFLPPAKNLKVITAH